MRSLSIRGIARVVLIVIGTAATASAQMPATVETRSLGGYGGSITDPVSGMGTGGPAIPYAGRFGGFMPSRMGSGGSGGNSLMFSTRSGGGAAMPTVRSPFRLAPMSGGMGIGSVKPMMEPRRMGVMPPSFGSPFRQPPSLLAPASGTGMSM